MEITGVRWTPQINVLIITCKKCGRVFEHPSNRWQVRCRCRRKRDLGVLREQYQRACAAGRNPLL